MQAIRNMPVSQIRRNPRNARTHPKTQIRQIANSIREFGFRNPILVDENSVILCGHGRLLAAQQLGMTLVPAIMISDLSEAKKRALCLAENRLYEGGGWDREMLAVEIPEVMEALREQEIDVAVLGFEPAEIDQLASDFAVSAEEPSDEGPPIRVPDKAVSVLGDLWCLGRHRLLCGDARDAATVARLMGPDRASMAFTDPPYNVRVRDVVGRGNVKHSEFAMASGEMSAAEFQEFLKATLRLAADYSLQGAVHFVTIDWRHVAELIEAGREIYSALLNVVCWVKSNAGQGSFYRSQHELIGVFRVGDAKHLNNIELGRHGRSRSNVWRYAGANTFRKGRMDDLRTHPTVKPVAMIKDALQDVTRRNEIVLDPFCGSGSTILAAEQVGRRTYALELEPRYVDAAVARWQAYSRKDAICGETGLIYQEIVDNRGERASAKARAAAR